jgi:hypothetical protein
VLDGKPSQKIRSSSIQSHIPLPHPPTSSSHCASNTTLLTSMYPPLALLPHSSASYRTVAAWRPQALCRILWIRIRTGRCSLERLLRKYMLRAPDDRILIPLPPPPHAVATVLTYTTADQTERKGRGSRTSKHPSPSLPPRTPLSAFLSLKCQGSSLAHSLGLTDSSDCRALCLTG